MMLTMPNHNFWSFSVTVPQKFKIRLSLMNIPTTQYLLKNHMVDPKLNGVGPRLKINLIYEGFTLSPIFRILDH